MATIHVPTGEQLFQDAVGLDTLLRPMRTRVWAAWREGNSAGGENANFRVLLDPASSDDGSHVPIQKDGRHDARLSRAADSSADEGFGNLDAVGLIGDLPRGGTFTFLEFDSSGLPGMIHKLARPGPVVTHAPRVNPRDASGNRAKYPVTQLVTIQVRNTDASATNPFFIDVVLAPVLSEQEDAHGPRGRFTTDDGVRWDVRLDGLLESERAVYQGLSGPQANALINILGMGPRDLDFPGGDRLRVDVGY